jgi:hypothetical protein
MEKVFLFDVGHGLLLPWTSSGQGASPLKTQTDDTAGREGALGHCMLGWDSKKPGLSVGGSRFKICLFTYGDAKRTGSEIGLFKILRDI